MVIETWKDSLKRLLQFYEEQRESIPYFFPKLFLFFVILNISCYWLAMYTAFSSYIQGSGAAYYFKIQFPVGILGALFDSFSFFITIIIIRRAIASRNTREYISHLGLDFVIAVLATFWVLFVFSFSGWLINLLEATPKDLASRNATYSRMLISAIAEPTANWRNIYFGLIMGISAMLPTVTHIAMFLYASYQSASSFILKRS